MKALVAAVLALSLTTTAMAAPRHHRLPKDFHWGRCLLVVGDQTRLSGRCAYSIEEGGDFFIEGPNQIYEGIDYPKSHGGAEDRSADYWAHVFWDNDHWAGYANDDIRETHGARLWETLRRQGACYVGAAPNAERVKVCLWSR